MQPGEQEKIKEVSDQFNRFQMMNFNEHHHCLRGTHLKTQGVGFTSCSLDCTDRSSVSLASSPSKITFLHISPKACLQSLANTI
jgi:hypothetical protein